MNYKIKKYIKSKEELTNFERLILNKYPENILSAIAEGGRGKGKSMFCYLVMARILQYLEGIHIDDAFPKALNYFLWTVPQTLKVIDTHIENTDYTNIRQYDLENKYRLLIVDDAGTHMGKYKFYTDVGGVDKLQKRLDIIRDITCGLILTTPAYSGLLSFLRDYPDNKTIELMTYHGGSKDDRRVYVRHKREKWAKIGKKVCPPIEMSIAVYDWAYDLYKVKKRHAVHKLLKHEKNTKKNEIVNMFRVVKKLNPKLTKDEIIAKLGLSEDVVSMFKEFKIINDKDFEKPDSNEP